MKAIFLDLNLDRTLGIPLSKQIYEHIRNLILSGMLAKGQRIETSRRIARHLGCGRNVVLDAIEHLVAEGYLQSVPRSGVVVALDVKQDLLADRPTGRPFDPMTSFSTLGRELIERPCFDMQKQSSLSPGLPDTSGFPFDVWTRLFRRAWRNPRLTLRLERDPAGYGPLRDAIARHLQVTRGLRCRGEHVMITSGTSNAISMLARVLLERGDRVWLEEPGYFQAQSAIRAAGMMAVPVPVGGGGFDVDVALSEDSSARMAIVSPSHQYPLGMTMSVENRLKLIRWAADHDGWVLEDDYNSEFRYAGDPLAPLQVLDTANRTIYLGTFAKTMLPNLRLGYLVASPDLIAALTRARYHLDGHSSYQLQPVVAAFIDEGHFARHIARMHRLYAARRQSLSQLITSRLGWALEIVPSTAGMHLVAVMRPGALGDLDDMALSALCTKAGQFVRPLSPYYLSHPRLQGLVIGFGHLDEARMYQFIETLSENLAPLRKTQVAVEAPRLPALEATFCDGYPFAPGHTFDANQPRMSPPGAHAT
jgi:GntR family transcriptional regulator/MocR family aminotransferase